MTAKAGIKNTQIKGHWCPLLRMLSTSWQRRVWRHWCSILNFWPTKTSLKGCEFNQRKMLWKDKRLHMCKWPATAQAFHKGRNGIPDHFHRCPHAFHSNWCKGRTRCSSSWRWRCLTTCRHGCVHSTKIGGSRRQHYVPHWQEIWRLRGLRKW